MSSATSIDKGSFRLKPEATRKAEAAKKSDPGKKSGASKPPETPDVHADGFKAWHFFVLASLVTATVAVVMSRQATPEHLILISFTIAATGAAAAAFYRMLAPLATDDASIFSEPLTERSRMALEREKALVMRSIKELEFDRAMGKLSPKDFDEMAGRLRSRAIMLMKQLDEGGSAYREIIERELQSRLGTSKARDAGFRLNPEGTDTEPEVSGLQPEATDADPGSRCSSCGTMNDEDATFCKRCGTRLPQEVRS